MTPPRMHADPVHGLVAQGGGPGEALGRGQLRYEAEFGPGASAVPAVDPRIRARSA